MKKRFQIRLNDKAFDMIIGLIVLLCVLLCLYPLYLVVINSISNPIAVGGGKVTLFPVGLSWEAYEMVFEDKSIVSGYLYSLYYTVVGTLLNMMLTIPAAYALSKPQLAARNAFMMFILFTMYFSGGLIPAFLLMKKLKLLNTAGAIFLSGAINSSNLIVARSFFTAVPHELEEAAEIDGASIPQTFIQVVLPLSKALLGVIVLYYAVARWNNYTSALYYLPMAQEKYPLQMVIRKLIILMRSVGQMDSEMAEHYAMVYNQIKYAVVVVASLPLMIIYPFLQKYFEKGVMLGSLKG